MSPLRSIGNGTSPTATVAINPWILAVAAFNAILGLGIVGLIASDVWSVDGDKSLRAALALANGTFGQERGYLYTPLAAAMTLPAAAWLPSILAVWGWFAARVGLLLVAVRRETRQLTRVDAALVAIGVLAFIPTIEDLMLGQVSVLILVAVAAVAWQSDGFAQGVPLGLILATVPKPALIPILIWMAIFRRRALVSAATTAIVLSFVGLVLLGWAAYSAWFDNLAHQANTGPLQAGNLSVGAVFPAILAWPLMAAAVIAFVIALRRGETPGFIACLCLGLLVAPYTMAYSVVLLLLALRPLVAAAGALAVLLAAVGSIAVVLFLPVWVGAILAMTLVIPRSAWTTLQHGAAT